MAIELGGGGTRDVRDIVSVRQELVGEGFATEDLPPPCDQIQPGGSDRDDGVLDAGGRPAMPEWDTAVAG